MRLLLVFVALCLAGCGVLDDEGPAISRPPDPRVYGPAAAVQREHPPLGVAPLQPPTGAVARRLAAGAIGVVDVTGTIRVKPRVLETAKDGEVESLTWTRWGADGAEGRGELRMLVCQPNCASGRSERVPARVTLSGVRTCDGRRYFETSAVIVDPGRTPSAGQPASYVRAPC